MRPSGNRLEHLHRRIYYGFSPQVSILKWEIISFFIQGIDQTSSQNVSKNPSEIEVWMPLEASWRRPGPSWASWGILGHLGWLHTAFRLGILAVLGASWGRLGGVLGRLGASLGASWGVSGRLGGVLGLIFYQNGTRIEPFHLESHFVFDF